MLLNQAHKMFSPAEIKYLLWKSKMRARSNLLTIIRWRHINIICLEIFLGDERVHQTVVTLAWFIVYTTSASLLCKGNASVEKKQNTDRVSALYSCNSYT